MESISETYEISPGINARLAYKEKIAHESCCIMITGLGEDRFQYFSQGVWNPANTIVDNGMQRGYSIYFLNDLVGYGKLAVYDEIDKELDVLDGGPLSPGWVTNFSEDYSPPPSDVIKGYQQRKEEFRKDFTTWELPTPSDVHEQTASSEGQIIYRLAVGNPVTEYGLDKDKKFRDIRFSIGFKGTSPLFPTITSSWEYYKELCPDNNNIFNYYSSIAEEEAKRDTNSPSTIINVNDVVDAIASTNR
ncbi:hypothetical protein NUW58_g1427 [Xylaria curta]|uniref:Uncharacterized protein n=1 Tax=Xylaria curta TaxID=42375 RepID=A0ACC1PMB7_9PEZI|nr:hypothetical protein NUW58_g1427 [Xylaria curta]